MGPKVDRNKNLGFGADKLQRFAGLSAAQQRHRQIGSVSNGVCANAIERASIALSIPFAISRRKVMEKRGFVPSGGISRADVDLRAGFGFAFKNMRFGSCKISSKTRPNLDSA
jgi:hypothetical protein